MKQKLLISFSGGRTSAYMTWWLMNEWANRHSYEFLIVFANTGKEREETLVFVQRCADYFGWPINWIEAVINPENRKGTKAKEIDFNTASRNGEPFEAMIAKYGIPNQTTPHCSRELKGVAIKAFARALGWKAKDYKTAIGIRYDEPQRIDLNKAKRERLIYPLATHTRITKSDVNLFWSKQPFDLELKSYEGNCDLCWKKSERKILTLLLETPDRAKWWLDMEQKYEGFIPDSRKHNTEAKPPFRFYRNNLSIIDLLLKSNETFTPAEDESKDIDKYKQLSFIDMVNDFDIEQVKEMSINEIVEHLNNQNLDLQEDGCGESCEAF